MKTFSAKPADIKREWILIDAADKTLGRLSTEVAMILRGKNKPEYTPHMDTGDYVVIINAEKVAVTGNKRKNKIYHSHTGYIGGIKSISFDKLIAEHPTRALEKSIKGMLPRNPLGRAMYKKLKVYAGENHPHTAQQPKTLNV